MRDKSQLAKEAAATAAAIVFWEIQLRMNMLANGSSGDLYHRRCNNKI